METILDSFDHRLARLEMTILPVYQQTGNLQRRQLSKDIIVRYYFSLNVEVWPEKG